MSLAVLALPACSTDRTPTFEYESEPLLLTADRFHVGDHLGEPWALRRHGPYLIAIDHASDHGVHVIDVETGKLEVSIGGIGEGPAEFRYPIAVVPDAEGQLWVADGGEQRAIPIDIARLHEGDAWAGPVVTFGGQGLLDAVRTSDGRWIIEGFFTQGRFALLDHDGRTIGYGGEVPLPDGWSPVAARQARWSALAAHPELNRFVAAGKFHATIELLDGDASVIGAADVPVATEPRFHVDGEKIVLTDDSPAAYVDVATSHGRIYALFGGRTDAEFGPYQNLGRDIHVFDWSGALLDVIRLDRDAFTLEVDEEAGWIYTVELDPQPAILRYPLPPQIGGEAARVAAASGTSEAR